MTARLVATVVLILGGCAAAPPASDPASVGPVLPSASVSPTAPSPTASPGATAEASGSPEASPPTWIAIEASGPAAREDHTWTLDPGGARAYLFGGRDGDTVHGDLWAYELATDAWTPVPTGSGPPPRFGHEAVWVDDVGLVIFGGQAGPSFFNDLWAFDPGGGGWSELPADGAVPVARYGSCAGIGPDGRLWISHGFTAEQARFADTRAYDFAAETWADETPDGGLPVNRCLHGCWWTDDGDLALYAGQTTGVTALGDRWLLSGGSWTRIDGTLPPARNLYARARLDGSTLVYGGQSEDGGYLADAWLLPDAAPDAEAIEVEGDLPPARAGSELIVDAERGRILLFGGHAGGGAFADTWAMSGDPFDRP